jgi:RecB family exonuclease
VGTTSNFSAATPRKILLGPFQPTLEGGLAAEIAAYKTANGSLAPLTVVVPTRLLGLHLRRKLAPHINVRFETLDALMQPARVPPRLGLELLCRHLARDWPGDYFAPVSSMSGFAGALLETFKDLEQAGLTQFTGKSGKLRELATVYAAYRQWLGDHGFDSSPADRLPSPVYLFGFYDLTNVQKQFVERLAPTAVFFPLTQHSEFSRPLLDWFGGAPDTPPAPRPPATVVSAPGETAEVREAFRTILQYVTETGQTFNDCAILCRSREQYDAIIRDTAATLGLPVYFRGGRPLAEQPDARLFQLLLEVKRSDYSRATVMELACHVGPHSNWDAFTVELGIVSGKSHWQRAARHPELADFIARVFAALDRIPREGTWAAFIEPTLAAFRAVGGRHTGVMESVSALAELDVFGSPVGFETFAEFCQKAIASESEATGSFQDGGIFVGDVMSARGLSFSCVVLLGLVEKSFPRVIREDPLLLDAERRRINANLSLKQRGYDEERLLFDLACGMARDRLVLSFPRIDPATAKPRVPSFLLLELTGAKDFKALEKLIAPNDGGSLDEREFDLPLLPAAPDDYLAEIAPMLLTGVQAERTRWRERKLTRYDGLLAGRDAQQIIRDRFGLEKLVTSATALEHFFKCPFFYFQKHVLEIERWEEPEATVVIESKDLGSLYHEILEDYFRNGGELATVTKRHFERYEREGVTGYAGLWETKKQIVREELAAFIGRKQDKDWRPAEFEKEFTGLAVAAPVRLRGKIDRIDLSPDDRRARVLDYKTGKRPSGLKNDALVAGEALQLPLYLLAAEKLLPGVGVETASYLYFTVRGGYRDISFSHRALEQRRDELTKLLDTAANMIRDGVFAQYATPENCRQCEFRPICGNAILKLAERKTDDERMATFREIKETVA